MSTVHTSVRIFPIECDKIRKYFLETFGIALTYGRGPDGGTTFYCDSKPMYFDLLRGFIKGIECGRTLEPETEEGASSGICSWGHGANEKEAAYARRTKMHEVCLPSGNFPVDPEACPGCGRKPGEGLAPEHICNHEDGCGYYREHEPTLDQLCGYCGGHGGDHASWCDPKLFASQQVAKK